MIFQIIWKYIPTKMWKSDGASQKSYFSETVFQSQRNGVICKVFSNLEIVLDLEPSKYLWLLNQ